ncbi:uncharacterized protein [Nicotiana tomentosiformis]|uniref:uncharacterized protein n=1 Tax=Nicotiana tomentosiformis TaxID=4098 RepID=UPI00051C1004|nr:uncharacterized protein LOC104101365 [Nicotiana tomentosiformis]
MDWLYPKRRGPEWKQGWTNETLASVLVLPLPLLAIFAIVIFLLSLSQYNNYKEQLEQSRINLQLFFYLVPVFLIFLMRSSLLNGGFNFWGPSQPRHNNSVYKRSRAEFPWGVAILVVVLIVLVSYQSSFQSKWFPFSGSD